MERVRAAMAEDDRDRSASNGDFYGLPIAAAWPAAVYVSLREDKLADQVRREAARG